MIIDGVGVTHAPHEEEQTSRKVKLGERREKERRKERAGEVEKGKKRERGSEGRGKRDVCVPWGSSFCKIFGG